MLNCIIPTNQSLMPSTNLQDFKPSCITVVEGSSSIVPDVLFRLCVSSVISSGRDALFVDGGNSFNPYALSKMVKSFCEEPRKVLPKIHVARAFTEYQMDALIHGLQDAVKQWNPSVLAISCLPTLFSGPDGMRLFEPLVEHLKLLTESSGIITAITSFGGLWYGDRLLASRADRVIRTEQPSKKIIRIIDEGNVFEYMPVPPWQTRLDDFEESELTGGELSGQNSVSLSCIA